MGFDSKRRADLLIVTEGLDAKAPRADATPVTKHQHGVSDTERIASARARAIQACKANNPVGGMDGFGYRPTHYQDFVGPETSEWDAGTLVSIANILETPILDRSKFIWQANRYDARTGKFQLTDTPAISIEELKVAIDARIAELGLSKALVWEWYVDHRDPIGQEWWRDPLETQIQRFKN